MAIVDSEATSHGATFSEAKLASVIRSLRSLVAKSMPFAVFSSVGRCLEVIRDDVVVSIGVESSSCAFDAPEVIFWRFRERSIFNSMLDGSRRVFIRMFAG